MIKWFTDRKAAKEQFKRDIELSEVAPRLHGVNLTEWRYLGRTVLSFVDQNNVATAKATLFAFCGIDDMDDRHFVIVPHQEHVRNAFDYHTYVLEQAALWEIGERDLWTIIGAEPSKWLREYMLERFNSVWDYESNWWVDSSSPPKAKKKTQLKLVEPTKDGGSEGNVVKVDFAKKGKEEDANG